MHTYTHTHTHTRTHTHTHTHTHTYVRTYTCTHLNIKLFLQGCSIIILIANALYAFMKKAYKSFRSKPVVLADFTPSKYEAKFGSLLIPS